MFSSTSIALYSSYLNKKEYKNELKLTFVIKIFAMGTNPTRLSIHCKRIIKKNLVDYDMDY